MRKKMDIQLFANSAEAVQGKQIVYLFRVFEDAATDAGTVLAFTTENENSASADSDSTVTKEMRCCITNSGSAGRRI